ncbi:MAG: hypothetical protein RLY61_890 [Candidatus Parcubacteria bacterium]|jgi:prepilin-type N-terminal cleavage/methylation domain-containing protein
MFKEGFTLIELLLVIAVIGVLSGVVLNVIDVDKTKGKARDGVRISNMGKLVQALEAYCIAEEVCPTTAEVTSFSGKITNYVKEWPQAVGGFNYNYSRLTPDTFVVFVNADRDAFTGGTDCYKYTTSDSKIRICPVARCGTNATMTGCTELAN